MRHLTLLTYFLVGIGPSSASGTRSTSQKGFMITNSDGEEMGGKEEEEVLQVKAEPSSPPQPPRQKKKWVDHVAQQTHPVFSKVVTAMEAFAPLHLADTSWDNVGVLIEAPQVKHYPTITTPLEVSSSSSVSGNEETKEQQEEEKGGAQNQQQQSSGNDDGGVFLTIDLTPKVLSEAIATNSVAIVAYHPIIFAGLKKVSWNGNRRIKGGKGDYVSNVVVRAIQHGISVYSPHTALDATAGGINDWLVTDVLGRGVAAPASAEEEHGSTASFPSSSPSRTATNDDTFAEIRPIIPSPNSAPPPNPTDEDEFLNDGDGDAPPPPPPTGAGRIATFKQPVALRDLLHRITTNLGVSSVRVALPPQLDNDDDDDYDSDDGDDVYEYESNNQMIARRTINIQKVAVCAGSGSGVFRKLLRGSSSSGGSRSKAKKMMMSSSSHQEAPPPKIENRDYPDLLLTGEMSHHDVLAATHAGAVVILTEHTNTERGFLNAKLRPYLEKTLGPAIPVHVSQSDRDPIQTYSHSHDHFSSIISGGPPDDNKKNDDGDNVIGGPGLSSSSSSQRMTQTEHQQKEEEQESGPSVLSKEEEEDLLSQVLMVGTTHRIHLHTPRQQQQYHHRHVMSTSSLLASSSSSSQSYHRYQQMMRPTTARSMASLTSDRHFHDPHQQHHHRHSPSNMLFSSRHDLNGGQVFTMVSSTSGNTASAAAAGTNAGGSLVTVAAAMVAMAAAPLWLVWVGVFRRVALRRRRDRTPATEC